MTDQLLRLFRTLLERILGVGTAQDEPSGALHSIADLPSGAWHPTCGRERRTKGSACVHVIVFVVVAGSMAWFMYLGLNVAVALLAVANAGLAAYLIGERILGQPTRRRHNSRPRTT